MAFEVKFSKDDSAPWGFRLTGGSDYGMPLTVVKVSEGSLADSYGLKQNDVVVRINDTDASSLTHDQAQEAILKAGNSFVATLFRNELAPVPDVPAYDGTEQVPIYGAKVTSMVYNVFSNTDTPLESSPMHTIETVQDNVSVHQSQSLEHQQTLIKTENIKQNEFRQITAESSDVKMIKSTETNCENNLITNNVEETVKSTEEILKNEAIVQEIKAVDAVTSEESKITKSTEEKAKNETIISKSEAVSDLTLEEAKINAINAASTLSQSKRRNSTEDARKETFRAFEAISKHKCFSIPCEASKLQTKLQTDVLLKTFFVHLTDVMVALTQIINSEGRSVCMCDAGCVCMNRTETESKNETVQHEVVSASNKTEKKVELVSEIKSEEAVVSKESNVETKSIKSTEQINTSQSEQVCVVNDVEDTKVVLQEVIQNIQTATGVDVTVNGKDPLEWLADLDEKRSETVKIEKQDAVLIQSDIKSITEVQEVRTESTACVEVKEVEQVERPRTPEEFKPSWDIKVIPTVPQTPNTEEYLFRLDVKLKGKIPDYPDPPEEPRIIKKPQPRKKPIFTIGDVKIEQSEVDGTSKNSLSDVEINKTAFTNVESEIVTNASVLALSNTDNATNTDSYLASDALAATLTGNTTASIVPAMSSITNPASNDTANGLIRSTNEQSLRQHANAATESQAELKQSIDTIQQNVAIEQSVVTNEEIVTKQESIMTDSVKTEDVTMESATEVQIMGEASKHFATVENNIQTITDEDIGKPGLPDDEIGDILSGRADIVKVQHKIGLQKVLASHMNRPDDEINTKDPKEITPMIGYLRDSEVLKLLNEEETFQIKAERIHEDRKKATTFLQKPNRPIPFCKRIAEMLTFDDPPYVVNLKHQPKKDDVNGPSILSEGVFLVPEVPILIPEPTPHYLEAPEYLADSSFPDLEDTGIMIPTPTNSEEPYPIENNLDDVIIINAETIETSEEPESDTIVPDNEDPLKIVEEPIDDALSMEEQLARVQRQLIALAQLPVTIQNTLDEVTKQLSKMVPGGTVPIKSEAVRNDPEPTVIENGVAEEVNNEDHANESKDEEVVENSEPEIVNGDAAPEIEAEQCSVEPAINGDAKVEPVKIDQAKIMEGMSENQKIEKLKKDLIDELNGEHAMRQVKQRPGGRVGRPKPAFGPLTPQERPIVLPGGRKWKAPRDALIDSFIAETLSGQAEVIMGKALGNHFENIYSPNVERESNCHLVCDLKAGDTVNFMKYNKPPKTLDHLKNSSVYKMIHDEEEEPHLRIHDRQPIVLAENDFRERCRSVTPTQFNGAQS